ncbi:maltokinase N-terminal cap-like domain-containing protein [Microbacterium indicum]|uniref:maltokinase N-terminal cap-like domain-containing protein n=1 Tax=Microbacterium indicum TaxID=358100 RepID=UPI000406CE9F|nr:hypothetical protein [Microbacterium indicum]
MIAAADLEAYLPRTRWFAGKGREFAVATAPGLEPGSAPRPGEVELRILLVTVAYEGGGSETYQVPVSLHAAPSEHLAHAFIGRDGDAWAYDAAHDREAMGALLAGFADAAPGAPTSLGGAEIHRTSAPGSAIDPSWPSSPLTGEQSNTSIRFGDHALLKLFRRVEPGANPDIEVHRVLTEAGSGDVAELYGWVEAGGLQLGMLQEFLATASDGFDMALADVRASFAAAEPDAATYAGEAAGLGRALARIHLLLADAFGTATRDAHALAAAMRDRLDRAILAVPELDAHAPRLRAVYDAVAGLGEIPVQRIHGDLHLGQALRTAAGWTIVDFEGEPAKTLAERREPDSPWRDVAGMIRSFDYAPAVVRMSGSTGDDERSLAWSLAAERAFVSAYEEESGSDGSSALLAAYLADKAAYEAVYEARNRPTWVGIPLAAVARIGSPREETP